MQYFNNQEFTRFKLGGSYRVFVLGGSVVMGFPFGYEWSFPHLLSVGLRQSAYVPQYEVINAGAFGYASYRVRRVLEEVLNYEPDLIVIMSGHNEFLEKRTYGDWTQKSEYLIQTREALDKLRIYRVLKKAVLSIAGRDGRPVMSEQVNWEHMNLDQKEREAVLAHYRYNITEMVRMCREKKVPLILINLPCNLKDFPPFKSSHKPGLSPERLRQWDDLYSAAVTAVNEKKWDEAIAGLNKAKAIDDDYAELYFYLGRAMLQKGQGPEALHNFWTAVDKDAWPVRALPEMNDFLSHLDQSDMLTVVNAVERFNNISSDGIPGDDIFLDHCHPDIRGQVELAKLVVEYFDKIWQNCPFSGGPDCDKKKRGWRPRQRIEVDQEIDRYISTIPERDLSFGYYRAAFETGINMKLRERGLGLAHRSMALGTYNPKLDALLKRLNNDTR